jgi:hypothetical protein
VFGVLSRCSAGRKTRACTRPDRGAARPAGIIRPPATLRQPRTGVKARSAARVIYPATPAASVGKIRTSPAHFADARPLRESRRRAVALSVHPDAADPASARGYSTPRTYPAVTPHKSGFTPRKHKEWPHTESAESTEFSRAVPSASGLESERSIGLTRSQRSQRSFLVPLPLLSRWNAEPW